MENNLKKTYESLQSIEPVKALELLNQLSNDDLINLAKMHEGVFKSGSAWQSLNNKIRSEIFKRNGLGFKQLNHLSNKQRDLLRSLGLSDKPKRTAEAVLVSINADGVREGSQSVRLDVDNEKQIHQSVVFDTADNWICITHDGNSISLSLENWQKLKVLANQVL